jgi:hypothetical protein
MRLRRASRSTLWSPRHAPGLGGYRTFCAPAGVVPPVFVSSPARGQAHGRARDGMSFWQYLGAVLGGLIAFDAVVVALVAAAARRRPADDQMSE